MAVQRASLSSTTYTESDHRIWATLYARQSQLVGDTACQLFIEGLDRLQLDPKRVPQATAVRTQLERVSGWTLGEAQNDHLKADWFTHLYNYRFPVTPFMRDVDSLDFATQPDLFHEYYGHLPFFTDLDFADTAHMFGPLYLVANERQRLEIARLWWFSVEFGLIKEEGRFKAFGAWLLSSPGELRHALNSVTPKKAFDIHRVANTPVRSYGYHSTYFVLEDVGHVRRILQDYARMEGLPVPQSAL